MLTSFVDMLLPLSVSLGVVSFGALGIALLPWTDDELELASQTLQRANRIWREPAETSAAAHTAPSRVERIRTA